MVLEDGRKVCEVADQLALSPDTLKNWLRAARAGKAFPVQHLDGKDLELERLRHEVRTLRMECEILKKAAAYFAKGTL
jgi:transposase